MILSKADVIGNMASLMPTLLPNPRALCIIPKLHTFIPKKQSSSKRWQNRQLRDRFTREAAVQGLKSRAAFKLLQVFLSFPLTSGPALTIDPSSFARLTRNIRFSRVASLWLIW